MILAEITGNVSHLATGIAVLGAAVGVGLIGFRAVEAVGRNPGSSGKVLPLALVTAAFAEGLGILAIFVLANK